MRDELLIERLKDALAEYQNGVALDAETLPALLDVLAQGVIAALRARANQEPTQ